MATIVKIKNVFEPANIANRDTIKVKEGSCLALYMHGDYVATMNSKQLTSDYIIQKNDNIIITPVLHGGSGSGKQILSVVAIIALTAVAGPAGTAAGLSAGVASGSAIIGYGTMYAVQAAILIGGGMLVNSMLAPDAPSVATSAGIEASTTYSWNGAKTGSTIGSPLPILYGTMRLPGNVINQAIDYNDGDEYLRLQLGLCHGPIKEIVEADVLLNDTSLTEFKGPEYPTSNGLVRFTHSTGELLQEPSILFNNLNTSTTIGATLAYNTPVVRTIAGTGYDILELILKAPAGVYDISQSSGKVLRRTAFLNIEYRESGSADAWVTALDDGSVGRHLEYEVVCSNGYESTFRWTANPDEILPDFCIYSGDPQYPNAYTQYTGRTKVVEETIVGGWYANDPEYSTYPNSTMLHGNSTKAITRNIVIPVDSSIDYEVRITKLDPDATAVSSSDTVIWDQFRGKVRERLRYPGVASVSIDVKATDQISGGAPNFSTLVTRESIEVYDDSGVFYGNRDSAIPAWAAWDLLTNTTYGAAIPYTDIDFQTFVDWETWCIVLADNGRGDLIPRARFNGIFDYNTNLWDALDKICKSGRAAPLLRGTKYSVVVDKPSPPVQMFNMGNIIKNSYSTVYTPIADLSTEIEIQFLNKDKNYANDQMSVQVPELFPVENISKKSTIRTMGIVSEAEAYRWGRYLLATSKYQRRTITFEASVDSIACTVGDVITFSHDIPKWGESGRITSVDSFNKIISLDRSVILDPGLTYTILIRFQDDTTEELVVTNPGVEVPVNTLEILDMVKVPDMYDIYTFGEVNQATKLFRINSITRSSELERTIQAAEYVESAINDDITIIPPATPFAPPVIPSVYNVTTNEHLELRQDGSIIPFLDVGWDVSTEESANVNVYISDYALANYRLIGTEIKNGRLSMNGLDLVEGTPYYFKFQVYNSLGISIAVEDLNYYSHTYLGKSASPDATTGFTATRTEDGAYFSWDAQTTDLDFSYYELRLADAVTESVLVTGLGATNYRLVSPLVPGSYTASLYSVDTTGNYSVPATDILTVDAPEDVQNFTVTIEPDGLLLSWDNVFSNFALYNITVDGSSLVSQLKANTYKYSNTRVVHDYVFEIEAENSFGGTSLNKTQVIYSETGPAGVTNVQANFADDGILISWSENTEVNRSSYEIEIDDALIVTDLKATNYKYAKPLPFGTYTVGIRAIDSNGIKSSVRTDVDILVTPPAAPTGYYQISGTDLETTLTFVKGSFPFSHFRIVYDEIDINISSTFYTVPIFWEGEKQGTIYAVDTMGNESAPLVLSVVILLSEVTTALPEVIDNNVLLTWEVTEGSLPVTNFNIYKGELLETAELIGEKKGTFTTIFESVAGIFTYWIEPIDSAGNKGIAYSTIASVNEPPDYILNADYSSIFDGTKINTVADGTTLIGPVNLTETYTQHFVNNGFASPQDQVTAGYPRWLSPFENIGSYEEVLDLGVTLVNSSITIIDSITIVDAVASVQLTVSVSEDGISYIDFVDTRKVYGTNFRYIKVRYDLASDTFGAVVINSLRIKVDTKLINDSGRDTVSANSSSGHEVFFNKAFSDISSITVTAGGVLPVTVIYDFVDVPTPTSFDVYAYDSNGVIMTTPVEISWSVKGY